MHRLTAFLIFLNLCFLLSDMVGQTLIINEVSNGPSGSQEYVEFVVVDNTVVYDCNVSTPPCIDIRGWIFDDNSGYHGATGVAAGAARFSNDALWSCVPLGTIIVIYNDADPNIDITSSDVTLADGNCSLIVPLNDPQFFEFTATTPGDISCSYPSTGWGTDSSPTWTSNTALANGGDCARLVDLNGCEVFSLCYGSANANPQIYFSGSGADDVWYFNGVDPYDQSNWSQGCAGDIATCGGNDQTPGLPNNAANQAYISQFNNNCSPITPMVTTATFTDAGCGCTGTGTATGSGSIAGYTFEWTDASYTPIGQSTATATGLCAGTYYVIGSSSIGCPDTAQIVISSNSSTINVTEDIEVCQNNTVTYPDGTSETIIASTSHTSNLITAAGCDSVIVTTVTMNPIYNLTETVLACQNTSVTYPDGTSEVIVASTSHTSNLTTTSGCDSIIVTTVNMNPSYNTTEAISTCQNSSVTYPDGTSEVITASTSHTSNLTSVNGCDSIIVTNVMVNNTITVNQNTSICSGDSFAYPDGTVSINISSSESHTSNFVTASGCDSLVTTNITVNATYNLAESVTVCQNNSVTYPDGTSEVITASTAHTSNLTTTAGCDSVIVTTVTMNPIYNLTETISVCENTSVTYPDGVSEIITSATSHTSNLTAVTGCDSIIVTTVNMNPIYNLTESILACENALVTYPDGSTETITSNTTHNSTFVSVFGCDSIITTNVQAIINLHATQDIIVCAGDSFTLPDGTVATNLQGNSTFTSTILSVAGCDSVITTNISVLPLTTANISTNLCSGESFTFPDGSSQNNITSALSQTSVLTSSTGCDSTVITNLSILNGSQSSEAVDLCSGISYSYPDGFSEIISQNTSHISVLSGINGCDSLVTTNISVLPATTIQSSDTLCPGENYMLPDGTVIEDFQVGATYSSTFSSVNGCDSIIETTLVLGEISVSSFSYTPEDPSIYNSVVTFTNTSSNFESFQWTIFDSLNVGLHTSLENIFSYTFDPENLGPYTVCIETSSSDNCTAEFCENILITSDLAVYIPNTFTPNHNGDNEIFSPVISGAELDEYEFLIFNRWGQLIFKSDTYGSGWDGTYLGQESMIDTYVYKVTISDTSSIKRYEYRGHVNLIR